MQNWKALSKETVLECGKWLTVENHTVAIPDGRVIPDWAWIITPDFVNVLPVTPAGKFLCFKQTKYAVEGATYATVGGYIEPNEDPLLAAQRELVEEMGYSSTEWVKLGQYTLCGNRGVGIGYLYLAKNAHFVGKGESDDLEAMETLELTKSELKAALKAGQFKVISWATTVALALQHLED